MGAGQGPRADFFVFFGDGCEEASLTRRLPLFLSSYYLVSLLSASLMFLAKFKIARNFMHFIVKTGTYVEKMLSRLNQIGNPSDYVLLIKILHEKSKK